MICQMIAALVLCETSLLEDPEISGPKGDEGVHAKHMWMVGLTTESLEGKQRSTSLIYRKHMVSAYFSFKPSSNRDIFTVDQQQAWWKNNHKPWGRSCSSQVKAPQGSSKLAVCLLFCLLPLVIWCYLYDFQNVGLSGGETEVLFTKKMHTHDMLHYIELSID